MVNTDFLNTSQDNAHRYNGTIPGAYVKCYSLDIVNENGLWQEVNPLAQSLPMFIFQLIIISGFNHLIVRVLKPLRQPLIVAEMLAGVLLKSGIGVFRKHSPFISVIFPLSRVMLLETFGNLGLVYYLFLLGLEMDLSTINRNGKKAFTIAAAGTVFTFAFGTSLYYIFMHSLAKHFPLGALFWGVSLSVTGLPVLADILASLKLLNVNSSKTAMSSAIVNEVVSWGLFVLVLTCIKRRTALYTLVTTVAFVFFCIYVIRPAILWITKKTAKEEEFSESTICIILTVVLACGFVTDSLGITSMVGAFVLGLVLPYEVIGHQFVVVLQCFITDLFMPVYFTLAGFRFQVKAIDDSPPWWLVVVIVVLLCVSKFAITMGASRLLNLPYHEGVTHSLLMNAKGILAVIAISAGSDTLELDDMGYAIMFSVILITTMSTAPIMSFLHYRKRRLIRNKHRSLQKHRPEIELRILSCFHETHNVAGLINLLEASYATRCTPICVFALQLIELTKQAAAFLIINGPNSSPAYNQTEKFIGAFKDLQCRSPAFSVHTPTALSSYDTMHEDICSMAEDNGVSLIILPFHMRQTIHNRMEVSNPSYKDINDNVLTNAPCSIAIYVDRGFGMKSSGISSIKWHIAMIYIGGPDDREALAYAARMGSHPLSTLTVIRLIPGENIVEMEPNEVVLLKHYSELEKQVDDNYVNEFRYRTASDNSIFYTEQVSNSGNQTVDIIKSIEVKYDLFVVGRGLGITSPLTSGLAEWSECPELGPIGDLLVTSDFSSTASVLVVKQYVGLKGNGNDDSVHTNSFDVGSESNIYVSQQERHSHFGQFEDDRDVEPVLSMQSSRIIHLS